MELRRCSRRRSTTSTATSLLLLVAAITLGLAACSSNTPESTPPGTGSNSGSSTGSKARPCAWPSVANEKVNNIAYPDTGATYWVSSYRLAPDEHLELAGDFPAARYMSFISYGPSGGVRDVVTDRDITPDAGSTNPFAGEGTGRGERHRYRVALRPERSTSANTINADGNDAEPTAGTGNPAAVDPLGSGRTGRAGVVSGTLIYRVYVPDRASAPDGGVGLPTVSLVHPDGSRTRYRTCPAPGKAPNGEAIVRKNGPATDRPAPAAPVFIRPEANGNNLYPNPDNVYVATITHYEPGRLVVVRGRAPTFPDTRAGDVITGQEQVRYWSMCTNEYRKPYPVSACVADQSVTLDAEGNYVFVVSTRAERPANATAANGVTWIDWGSTKVDMLLLLRNMLARPDFAESAIRLAPGALATSTMGIYAPRGAYCSVATFARGGPAAC